MIAGMKAGRTLALAVLPLALLAACTSGSPGPTLETSPSRTAGGSTTAPSESPSGVVVPDLRGLETTHADRLLEAYGLKMSVDPIGGKTRKLVAQRPKEGTVVELNSIVTVQAK
jgi:hypothetical protein